MGKTEINLEKLIAENDVLKTEIQRLQNLLSNAGIDYSFKKSNIVQNKDFDHFGFNENITVEQIDLFSTLFRGRTDVFARRFISKSGNVGIHQLAMTFGK